MNTETGNKPAGSSAGNSVLLVENANAKKSKTARNPDSITKGALLLPLNERAKLRDALIASVQSEIQALKDQASAAEKLLG